MSVRAHSSAAGDEFERPAGAAPSFDLFLAYNSQDEGAVTAATTIKRALEDHELEVWFASDEVIPGQPITQAMMEGIASSRCCALLHGKKGFGRWQSSYEQSLATLAAVERRDFRIFAVLLPDSPDPEALPDDLRTRGALDLRGKISDEEGLTEEGLIAVLGAASAKKVSELREVPHAVEAPGRNRALLVNVGTYSDPDLKRLHGPRSDVALLERALARAGMPRGKEWMVTTRADPDITTLRDTIREFFGAPDAHGDTVLFYYSGHGVVEDDSYVCATDTELKQLAWTAISARQIVELLEQCTATAKVVILDCCHAARIARSAYEKLPDDVAVVLGSRGPVEDAEVGSEPSPFTRSIVDVLGDPDAYGDAGLTVGDLLTALAKRDEKPWTNPACARGILLARRTESSEPLPRETRPAISLEISSPAEPDDRLPLVRQLAAMLDGMLAMAPEERQVPTPVVSQTMQLLASELRRLALTPEQARDLDQLREDAVVGAPQTCAVRFADDSVRRQLADLPWEYLALQGSSPERKAQDENDPLRCPPISIERVFGVPRTKRAGAAIQRVLLFSSLTATEHEDAELLTGATEQQLTERFSLTPEVTQRATWNMFSGAPESADVVILQAPVRLREGRVQVLFTDPASDEPKPVPAESIGKTLENRPELTWLFIETVAANSRHQSALAVRRLAEYLATQLARPVVAVCHSRAYLSCLRGNLDAATFLPHLLGKLDAKWPLDHAAHAARDSVVSSLAVNDPAIIGFPIVMRPVEREAPEPERPVARR
jgi:hypothetical protein